MWPDGPSSEQQAWNIDFRQRTGVFEKISKQLSVINKGSQQDSIGLEDGFKIMFLVRTTACIG